MVCSTRSSQGSDDSADGAGDGGDPVSPAPPDGLQSSLDDDDNLDIDVGPSGGQAGNRAVHGGNCRSREEPSVSCCSFDAF